MSSLYTTIPQDEGIIACIHFNKYACTNLPSQALLTLFNIVLKGNIFRFNNAIYSQLTGAAMGTKMAPAYANCFMHLLELQILETQELKPLLWKKYIDDILMLWTHSIEELETFLQKPQFLSSYYNVYLEPF